MDDFDDFDPALLEAAVTNVQEGCNEFKYLDKVWIVPIFSQAQPDSLMDTADRAVGSVKFAKHREMAQMFAKFAMELLSLKNDITEKEAAEIGNKKNFFILYDLWLDRKPE